MAEDLEGTQKPKAELIKHTHETAAGPNSPAADVPGRGSDGRPQRGRNEGAGHPQEPERRKVIVVKKKPGVPPADPSVPVKRVQPRVSVSPRPENQREKKDPPAEGTAGAEAGRPALSEKAREDNRISSLPVTQRPAAAAGRVGGRPVGRFREDG